MRINEDIITNDVSAERQTSEKCKVTIEDENAVRVLFLGNSITLHEKAPQIGWNVNWGMAASAEDKDYVHLTLDYLRGLYGKVNYCVTNVGEWEKHFNDDEVLKKFSAAADFGADIVIFRLGENVDKTLLESADFKGSFEKFCDCFTTKAKETIVTDTFWEHEGICSILESVAKSRGYTFVKICDLGYDDANKATGLFWHNGVAAHPGDLGMKRIAERISGAIRKV